jgi:hypothetical protein
MPRPFSRKLVGLIATLAAIATTAASAETSSSCSTSSPQNIVNPGDGQWTANLQEAATAAVTGANPRSGNGSLDLSVTGNLTDWGFFTKIAPAGGWGLLDQINCLSFDWYRESIATPTDAPWSAQTPVLRLYIQDGTTLSELVWEKYYTDGSPTVNDQWNTENLLDDNFWRVIPGEGYTIAGCNNVDPFFPNPLLTQAVAGWSSSCFSSDAFVYAIGIGVGSNWPYEYQGYVDNVALGFSGQQTLAINDNFEMPTSTAPEPATVVLMASGLVGCAAVGAWKKRKQRLVA